MARSLREVRRAPTVLPVGFLLGLSLACGARPPPPCGPSTCASGCCDALGECSIGPSEQACGTGGGACSVCGAREWCFAGACLPQGDGGLGSDAGAGRDGGVSDAGRVDSGQPADAGGPGADGGAPDASAHFATDVFPIFQSRCTPCHNPNSQGSLSLALPATAHSSLVEVVSQCGGAALRRVAAGAPLSSLLYLKLIDHPDKCLDKMPRSQALGLADPAATERVRRWIADGAKND